jgi:hypothetical protein
VVTIEDKVLYEGDWLSLNGSTGDVILGKQPLSPPALSPDLETFMSWVDEVRQLKVNFLEIKEQEMPQDEINYKWHQFCYRVISKHYTSFNKKILIMRFVF